jgi:hypothetical protein
MSSAFSFQAFRVIGGRGAERWVAQRLIALFIPVRRDKRHIRIGEQKSHKRDDLRGGDASDGADQQRLGDAEVRLPFGELGQHVALPVGQLCERPAPGASGSSAHVPSACSRPPHVSRSAKSPESRDDGSYGTAASCLVGGLLR